MYLQHHNQAGINPLRNTPQLIFEYLMEVSGVASPAGLAMNQAVVTTGVMTGEHKNILDCATGILDHQGGGHGQAGPTELSAFAAGQTPRKVYHCSRYNHDRNNGWCYFFALAAGQAASATATGQLLGAGQHHGQGNSEYRLVWVHPNVQWGTFVKEDKKRRTPAHLDNIVAVGVTMSIS